MRIKHSEIAEYRSKILTEQGHQCALCNHTVAPGEAVLDHDHRSGYIRGTLHRGCNALLGKIENSLRINKISPERLSNILKNTEFYINSHTLLVHPLHRTPEEKLLARRKKTARARKQRASK